MSEREQIELIRRRETLLIVGIIGGYLVPKRQSRQGGQS
jgi:hypothetical protein